LGVDARAARMALHHLTELGSLSVSDLARADDERKQFIRNILAQVGIDSTAASAATTVLVGVATVVTERWGGHIQRFLRRYGDEMVNELGGVLASSGLDSMKSTKAAILWLQNAAHLPVLSVDDQHVRAFLKMSGISGAQLLAICDKLDLNVSVLDDILASAASESKVARQPMKRRATRSNNNARRRRASKRQ